jgi:hypothetical protein
VDTENLELPPDNDIIIELVLRDMGLEYIPKRTKCIQKNHTRQPWGLYMGFDMSLQKFVERLNELNHYLFNFPG